VADVATVRARIRREIGDPGESFQSTSRGNGSTRRFELPYERVGTDGFRAYKLDESNSIQPYVSGTDYDMNYEEGVLTLHGVLGVDEQLFVEGRCFALFSDAELDVYVQDALKKHVGDREVATRSYNINGFIEFIHLPLDLINLPDVEEPLVALLASIDVLWTLATDASTDIDVVTAEGTSIPRSQRYRQLMQHIAMLTMRYKELCQQLNVGFFRIEMSNLRRVSRTTGRYVPIYQEREYDDHSIPVRLLPPIDAPNPDYSGIASPNYGRSY
jgi:hypothetical protein